MAASRADFGVNVSLGVSITRNGPSLPRTKKVKKDKEAHKKTLPSFDSQRSPQKDRLTLFKSFPSFLYAQKLSRPLRERELTQLETTRKKVIKAKGKIKKGELFYT